MQFTAKTQCQILKKMGCKALFLTRSPQNMDEIIKNIVPDIDETQEPQNLKCKSLPDLKFIIAANHTNTDKRICYTMESVLSMNNASLIAQVQDTCMKLNMDDPCVIYFTSGTTAIPKAVVHCHHVLLNTAVAGFVYRSDVEGFNQDWVSDIR
ncbi:medium-chain acyl-CoA ligase ACSF2, mitochondrial-like [Amphiura filiformis]|uniref:medium-chain acyl-CoA ligase ACSF2, mitochondrial-like n=1 Tax=Amphiura filiformis TaxID=82378 RepID=UPI003B21F75A